MPGGNGCERDHSIAGTDSYGSDMDGVDNSRLAKAKAVKAMVLHELMQQSPAEGVDPESNIFLSQVLFQVMALPVRATNGAGAIADGPWELADAFNRIRRSLANAMRMLGH